MPEKSPRPSMRFYDALPKHKVELVDGRMYLGGSLTKSAMALGYMVQQLGARYVAKMVPRDLLSAAVIKVYGKEQGAIKALADFKPVKPSYYPPTKMASDLRMGLFMEDVYVGGGTQAIKLGEDVFMPDIYILTEASAARQREYYLEGVPDLAIEVSVPFMRPFDFGTRLDRYARAGLPEVWMIDFGHRTFQPMLLENGEYRKVPVSDAVFFSKTIAGFGIEHGKVFDSVKEMGMHPLSIFTIPDGLRERRSFRTNREKEPRVPFKPHFALEPVLLHFKEFIYWGGEVKFEMKNNKPVFGGGYETTKEWLGLLIMTMGVVETVKYLPAEEWSKVI